MLGFSIRKKPKNDPIFLETAKNFLKKSRSGFGTFLTPNLKFFSDLGRSALVDYYKAFETVAPHV